MNTETILELLRLKCKIRIRGLELDIKNGYKYDSSLYEYEELLRHLEKIDWIITDIDCGLKYLTDEEKSEFCKILTKLNKDKVEND